jgi:DNA-binding response OmpR family regulator
MLMSKPRVLRVAVIDNDSGFIRVLTNRMDAAGWQHRVLASAVPPQELVAMKVNAVLVDITVMAEEGWAYLERICGLLPDLGVIVCTSGGTVAQRVRGLRVGADDWINKPCHPEEVVARIEAVARRRRRARSSSEQGPLVVGEIEIRSDQFQAFVAGESLDLTRREFELLHLLAEDAGNVIEREAIYQKVWGYAMAHGDRSVDVFVRKLRHKLEKRSPGFRYIHTHFGVGYRFAAEASVPEDPSRPPDKEGSGRAAPQSAEALSASA